MKLRIGDIIEIQNYDTLLKFIILTKPIFRDHGSIGNIYADLLSLERSDGLHDEVHHKNMIYSWYFGTTTDYIYRVISVNGIPYEA